MNCGGQPTNQKTIFYPLVLTLLFCLEEFPLDVFTAVFLLEVVFVFLTLLRLVVAALSGACVLFCVTEVPLLLEEVE